MNPIIDFLVLIAIAACAITAFNLLHPYFSDRALYIRRIENGDKNAKYGKLIEYITQFVLLMLVLIILKYFVKC